jgi:succinoglycan biosynthesis transport protein ExoP
VTARAERQVQESYRKTAHFLSKLAAGHRGQAVQVASATRREGTTTVVLTLANRLRALHGLKVLVVEIGARNDLVDLLELDRERTFESFAAGRTTAAETVQTTSSGLFVIPSMPHIQPGAEYPLQLRRMLTEVQPDFDMVLLDVPPVLESVDALIVGAIVPQLLLVVESGRTRYEVVQRAKKELEAEGIQIIATVLNKQRRFVPGWIYRWLIE